MQTRNRSNRASRRRGTRFAIATISMLATAAVAWAAAGNLDPSFGDSGIAVAGAIGVTPGTAVDSADGSILVCGAQAVSGTDPTGRARSAWLLRRFSSDGTVDTGFGSSGAVTLFGDSDDAARRVAIDSASGAVVLGTTTTFETTRHSVTATSHRTLVRLNANGSLDTSFGSSGVVRVTPPGSVAWNGGAAGGLLVQSDGKIVVAGSANFKIDKKGTIRAYPFLARYSASGTLDTTFGTSGFGVDKRASVSLGAIALARQSTGHFVLALKGSGVNWMITRHLASGEVDTGFAAIVQSGDYIGGIAADGTDRIVATGRNTYSNGQFDVLVARYSATGSPDGSFGSSGRSLVHVTNNQNCWADPIVQPADGKIVVGANLVGSSGVAATLRLLDDGSLDDGYGTGGVGDTVDPFSRGSSASAVAFAPDGRIVLVGLTTPSTGSWNWMLARYDAN